MKTVETSKRIAVNNILFATDFSPSSNAALPYALAVAHQFDAKLFATHVISPEAYLFASPETWPALREIEEQQRQDFVARLEAQLRGVPHQVLSQAGDIADVLFRLIHDHQIDLLVLGTHGRTGLQKLLLGSVAEKLFRQAHCPVLTVGPEVLPSEKPVAEFNRILFATDFSNESLAAAPYTIALAQEHQSRLTLLHVLEEPQAGTVDFGPDTEFVIRQLRELVSPEQDLWFEPEYVVEFGQVETQILKAASAHKADLIVLGVRALTGSVAMATHFGHSKAQLILAHAPCPVLTVRG